MTLEERVDLVLAVARVLFVNGQSTEQTLAAAERLGDALGLHAKIIPRWGELQFQSLANDARLISAVSADPTNVAMGRVASAMRAVDDLSTGRIKPDTAKEGIRAISEAPPAPTWLFTLAAAAGAAALAVIFGLRHEVIAMLKSSEYAAIKKDYDEISRAHFARSYFFPEGMSFANSDALFPPAELARTISAEYEAQCRMLCYGPYPSWAEVHARLLEIRDLL
jgi:hypothetical protein